MIRQNTIGFIKHAIKKEEVANKTSSITELQSSQDKFKQSNPLFQHSHLDFSQIGHQNNLISSLGFWAIKVGFSNGFWGI